MGVGAWINHLLILKPFTVYIPNLFLIYRVWIKQKQSNRVIGMVERYNSYSMFIDPGRIKTLNKYWVFFIFLVVIVAIIVKGTVTLGSLRSQRRMV